MAELTLGRANAGGLERQRELQGRLIAAVGIAFQRLLDHLIEGGVDTGAQLAGARHGFERQGKQKLSAREARIVKQPLADQGLPQHHASRKHVRPGARALAPHLLGSHVGELADQHARSRVLGVLGGFCCAEVEDLDVTGAAQHDVLR
jgi:hypothetical protein